MIKNIKKYTLISACVIALISCEKEEVTLEDSNANQDVNMTKNAVSASSNEGGSLAQFTIVDDYLYTVDYKTLKVFDVANAETPSLINTIKLGVGIETIHAQNDMLFIGTNDGVRMVSISDPAEPVEVSEYDHLTSCDPVVVNGDYAIATLRGGTECGGDIDAFDIIDISDIEFPELVASTELENPYGLSFSNSDANLIYICDGNAGLKAFDISDVDNIELVMTMNFANVRDIIITDDNTLIVLSSTGIYQFDGTDALNLVEKSFIGVN